MLNGHGLIDPFKACCILFNLLAQLHKASWMNTQGFGLRM